MKTAPRTNNAITVARTTGGSNPVIIVYTGRNAATATALARRERFAPDKNKNNTNAIKLTF
jgi:hypothetical protein